MIGLSLSMCIKDIMSGKVSEFDVTKIVTSTAVQEEWEWNILCARYGQVYWRAFEGDAVTALIQRLRAQGKIEQPRLHDPEHFHSISGGCWVSENSNGL